MFMTAIKKSLQASSRKPTAKTPPSGRKLRLRWLRPSRWPGNERFVNGS